MFNIPGARASPLTSQLLVSSGVPSLDKIIGGGLPVGSITLIEEDEHGAIAKTMLRYFLAEAVVCKQHSLTVGLDYNPSDILKHLPALAEEQPKVEAKSAGDEQMKIAFRYQNLPTKEKEVESAFGHYYDLSQFMPASEIDHECHQCITDDNVHENVMEGAKLFQSDSLNFVIRKINSLVKDVKFSNDEQLDKKNILRICIHQLGTIMWDNIQELPKFLYYLRCILRQCFGVAMITVPTHLSQKLQMIYKSRLMNSADIVLRLFSFSGTHYEKNKALADFHGFFYVDKLAPINTLLSAHPGAVEYTFKLLRKKFCIEVLHLPAGIDLDPNDEKTKRHQTHAASGCGSSGGRGTSLDF